MKGELPYWEKCFLVTLIFLGKKGLSPFPESTLPSVTNQLVYVDRHQQTLCFVHFSMLCLLNVSFSPQTDFLNTNYVSPCSLYNEFSLFIHDLRTLYPVEWIFTIFRGKYWDQAKRSSGACQKCSLLGLTPRDFDSVDLRKTTGFCILNKRHGCFLQRVDQRSLRNKALYRPVFEGFGCGEIQGTSEPSRSGFKTRKGG